MRYFLFYKNSKDVIGWLESENVCEAKNAKEVSREEYLKMGGTVRKSQKVSERDPAIEAINILLDNIIQ